MLKALIGTSFTRCCNPQRYIQRVLFSANIEMLHEDFIQKPPSFLRRPHLATNLLGFCFINKYIKSAVVTHQQVV